MELKDHAWQDEPCFLVGGGPSLRSFPFHLLRDKPQVMVINRAFLDVPTADIFITEDIRFLEKFGPTPEFRDFPGHKVFAMPDPCYLAKALEYCGPNLSAIHSREKAKGWSTSIVDGLSTSSNSGIPALDLMDILGADPIYLLGFDCAKVENRISNYHNSYPEMWATGSGQLDSFRSDFEHWAAPNIKRRKKNVINLINPDMPSAITCWPKEPWDKVFKI